MNEWFVAIGCAISTFYLALAVCWGLTTWQERRWRGIKEQD